MFSVNKHAAPPAHQVMTDYINSGTSTQSPADVSPQSQCILRQEGCWGSQWPLLSNEGEQKEIEAFGS